MQRHAMSLRPFLVALVLVGCRTVRDESPAGMQLAQPQVGVAVSAWEVLSSDSALIGSVVRFETNATPKRAYYSVRNTHQQEVGIVDSEGRAWRHVMHQRDPEWLGSGTVEAGAGLILADSPRAKLVSVTLADLASGTSG